VTVEGLIGGRDEGGVADMDGWLAGGAVVPGGASPESGADAVTKDGYVGVVGGVGVRAVGAVYGDGALGIAGSAVGIGSS
jgi:hypothetical protein